MHVHRRCQHALQLTKAPSGHSGAGIAVIFDMVLTTHFMTLLMVTVWRKHLIFPAMFYTIFAGIELTYVSSAVRKVRSSLLPTHGFYLILKSPATIACPCSTSNCPTVQAVSHALCAGARRRLVLFDDGGHLCLHHAAVVLWVLAQEQVRSILLLLAVSPRRNELPEHGILACRRLDVAPCPPRQRHVQLSLYDTSSCTSMHVICASCCFYRFFEATRRQLGDLLRVRHPKAGVIVTKPQPALASARGKLQLCVQFLSLPAMQMLFHMQSYA